MARWSKKIGNKGFVATGVLYSLITIIAVILFLVVQNNFTINSTVYNDTEHIKDNLSAYTIIYDNNGGTGTMESSTFASGEVGQLRTNTFTRTGYIFLGWGLSSYLSEAPIPDKAFVSNYESGNTTVIKLPATSRETITLYAVWKPADATIPTMSFFATKVTSGNNAPSGIWSDEGLTFTFRKGTSVIDNATISYCMDTNNSCTPSTIVTSGTTIVDYTSLEGTYYIRFQIVNSSGKSSGVFSYMAKVDTVVPKASIKATKVNSPSETVLSEEWSNESLNFTITWSDVRASGATMTYCVDRDNTCIPSNATTASSISITAVNTAIGTYYVRYKIVSGAGLTSGISVYTAKIDTVNPIASIKATKVNSPDETVESGEWSDDGLNFTITQQNVGTSGGTITYCIDRNNTCEPRNPTTASSILIMIANTETGTYYVRYKITSAAGATSGVSVYTAKVDNVVPKASITAKQVSSGATVESGVWSKEGLNFTIAWSDVRASGATMTYCVDRDNLCTPSNATTASSISITSVNNAKGIYYVRYQIISGAKLTSGVSVYIALVE